MKGWDTCDILHVIINATYLYFNFNKVKNQNKQIISELQLTTQMYRLNIQLQCRRPSTSGQ